jgi:hypothetical protein
MQQPKYRGRGLGLGLGHPLWTPPSRPCAGFESRAPTLRRLGSELDGGIHRGCLPRTEDRLVRLLIEFLKGVITYG